MAAECSAMRARAARAVRPARNERATGLWMVHPPKFFRLNIRFYFGVFLPTMFSSTT